MLPRHSCILGHFQVCVCLFSRLSKESVVPTMQVRFHGVREVSSLAGDPPHPLRPPAHPTKQTPSTNQKSTVQTTPATYRNKPHQQTRNQQFHQILEPTKQTPSTNQKSTVQTNQKVQVLLLLRRSTHTHTHRDLCQQPVAVRFFRCF